MSALLTFRQQDALAIFSSAVQSCPRTALNRRCRRKAHASQVRGKRLLNMQRKGQAQARHEHAAAILKPLRHFSVGDTMQALRIPQNPEVLLAIVKHFSPRPVRVSNSDWFAYRLEPS